MIIPNDANHTNLGAVVLSGFLNAARLASAASGQPLSEQRILFFGAGSAGIGVAKQLLSFFKLLGMNEEDAKKRIYVGCFSFLVSLGISTLFRPWIQKV